MIFQHGEAMKNLRFFMISNAKEEIWTKMGFEKPSISTGHKGEPDPNFK